MSFIEKTHPNSGLYGHPDVPKLTRDNDLDLLRFLLAACVVFYHSLVLADGLNFPLARVSAVPVFLFLSGLLITESFYGSPSLKSYVEKRVRRIYPAYLAVVIFGGVLAFFGWRYLAGQTVTLSGLSKYLAYNSVFANWLAPCVTDGGTVQGQTCTVNGSLWVMKWEVIFYAALPAILIIFARLNKWIWTLLLIALAFRVSMEPSPYIRIFLCFLMGISAYYLKPVWMSALKKLPPVPPLLRQAILIAIFFIAAKIWYGAFILILMLITFYPTRQGAKFNIMKYGDVSYGVFLIHFPIITAFFLLWPGLNLGPWISFAVLGTAIILSLFMYKFIEAPFLLPSSYYRKAHEASKINKDVKI